jgi:hypothetical protein
MKKLDLSAVTTSIGFPVKHGTMDHLQSAYQEALAALAKSTIGSSYDATKVYILYGCVATGTDPGARTFSAGAVFYNGEVYLVDAASFIPGGSLVSIGTITTTFYSSAISDPVIFTDGISRNVHQIRKIVISAGASGSGTADFSTWEDIDAWVESTSTAGINIVSPSSSTVVGLTRRWNKYGSTITMSFRFNFTAGANSIASISLPLGISGIYGVHDFSCGTINTGSAATKPIIIQRDVSSATDLQLLTYDNLVSGTTYTVQGQITYKRG